MANSKRVLYIGTPIFNYHLQIINEFKIQGFEVDFYNDRPSESSFIKGLIKIKKNLVDIFIKTYFERILTEIQNKKYDLVFIVNGKVFNAEMIKQLRECQKSAKFIFYMWDSLTLYPHAKELISLFDKAYSFDSEDCNKIPELNFLPLFYCKSYEQIGNEICPNREYEIVSICTAHPNRYTMMKELFPRLTALDIKLFSYMYINKLQFLYNKCFVKEFRNAKRNEFKFNPLSEKDSLNIIRKSYSVFDMQHNMQSGLTMRTIEALGAKRKLITTNANIKNYNFYNEQNIFIMDQYNWKEIKEFIKLDYKPIDEEIYQSYSINSWVGKIIGKSNNGY